VATEVNLPPTSCTLCRRTRGFWRYKDMTRWHCVACAPCPDADDAVFDWHLEPAPAPVVESQRPIITPPAAIKAASAQGYFDAEGFYVYGADEREPGQEG